VGIKRRSFISGDQVNYNLIGIINFVTKCNESESLLVGFDIERSLQSSTMDRDFKQAPEMNPSDSIIITTKEPLQ
jgi:hypothetical protein